MAPINLTSKVDRFKSKRKVLLPRPLKEKLDSCNLTRLQREKATRFLWLIIKESTRSKKRNLSSFIPRPRNYMREVFNSRYAEWLQVLKNDILEVKGFIDDDGTIIESYSIDKYSKSYRIRAELLSTEWVESSYTEEASENCETLRIAEEVVRKSIVYDDLRQLLINEEKLKAVTEEYAASITANHFRIDDQISTCYIRHVVDNCTGYEGPSSVSESLKRAKEMGVNLIQDGDSFFIDDINDYIIRKKRNVRVSYYHSIKALVEGWFYANRNGTNRRLDHNLTALPSLLLEVVKQDNDLEEIDLINSQYAILAYLMQRDGVYDTKKDFLLFRELVSEGTLYEYIQEYFHLGHRSVAKNMMMAVAFSSYRTNTSEKLQFKELFPSVVKFIDDYKRSCVPEFAKDASKRFSILLQQTEAEIFVDGIYSYLKKQGLWCITRHDSVLIRSKDTLSVYQFMNEYFDHIGLRCALKIN